MRVSPAGAELLGLAGRGERERLRRPLHFPRGAEELGSCRAHPHPMGVPLEERRADGGLERATCRPTVGWLDPSRRAAAE